MILRQFIVGPVETNCYLVGCPITRAGAVIDPGDNGAEILDAVQEQGLDVQWILNTHGHADHIAANGDIKHAFPAARIGIHPADAACLEDAHLNLSAAFGFPITSPPADVLLEHDAVVGVGKISFRVIHLPGHTPGGAAFFSPEGEAVGDTPVLFSGDALFADSVGRTDFPGGSHDALITAIRERLLTLPPETRVYPGHGEATTIGREKASNPFL